MADVRTNLRELSVIVGVFKEVNKSSTVTNPIDFTNICQRALPSVPTSHYSNISGLTSFDVEQKQIIANGFSLSKAIIQKFAINTISEMNWFGFVTQKEEPYDICINNLKFSLKEESFILENMGLYKLLNCYTGSHYTKRHIFSDYARNEYETWFQVTWSEMKNIISHSGNRWTYENMTKGKSGVISVISSGVELVYYENSSQIARTLLPSNCTLSDYERMTTSKTREEVFAKFIKQKLDSNNRYNSAKRACALSAANALARELRDNLNYHAGLPRFLRIHENAYYYAKTTTSGVEIYKVPALHDFENNISIESIEPSVPDKQANILTTIRNKKTGHSLILRNECRFSHGQFNGTPEAKMYYENGGSLLTIYEPV